MKRFALTAGLLALVLAGCTHPGEAGSPAPPFSITSVADGQTKSLSDFKGKPVVIDFWATWCPPCRKALPEVQKLSETYGPKGVQFVGLSDEDVPTLKQFVKDANLTYPIYADTGLTANKGFNVEAFPTMVILDKDGTVVYRDTPPDMDQVKLILDRMARG